MKKTIRGKLILEGPLYRGNARKTIFSRGENNDVFLPGKIDGQAKAMMSAFTGFWQHPKNPRASNAGLFEKLCRRQNRRDLDFVLLVRRMWVSSNYVPGLCLEALCPNSKQNFIETQIYEYTK